MTKSIQLQAEKAKMKPTGIAARQLCKFMGAVKSQQAVVAECRHKLGKLFNPGKTNWKQNIQT